jgi:hypothetical protein
MENLPEDMGSSNGRPPFVDYRCGQLRGVCLDGFEGFDLAAIPWDEIKVRPDLAHQLAKTSRTRRVVRVEFAPPRAGARGFFVKRVLIRSWRKRLGCLVAASKAKQEWEAGFRLLSLGFATPRPVIFAEHWRGPWLAANYIATEEIRGAVALRHEIERVRGDGQGRRRLFEQLAHWLWGAHRSGFYHDDCSTQHIFVARPPDGAAERGERRDPTVKEGSAGVAPAEGERLFWFIDLDNCRFYGKPIPWRRRVKNLFQLLRSIPPRWATRTDRLRFIRAYLEAAGDEGFLRAAVEGMHHLAVAKNANIHLLADRRKRSGTALKKKLEVGGGR